MLIGVALDDDDDDDYDLLTLNQPRSYVDWAGRRRYYNDRIELRVTGLKLCVNYEGPEWIRSYSACLWIISSH